MDNQPAPPQHTAKSVARNIGIGVVTPVLAATIIYFLGFNRSDNNADFKKRKEATISVWTALMQNRAILSKVFTEADQNVSDEVAIENVNHEVDITVDNMENIKKEPNADPRVYSSIDIITEQMKSIKTVFKKMADDVMVFNAQDHPDSVKNAFADGRLQEMIKELQAIMARDTTRLNTFYNGLNKDYNIKLPNQ